MVRIAKRRRLWPWGLMAAAVLFCAWMSWSIRPLNPSENRLAGKWVTSDGVVIHFLRNRTIEDAPPPANIRMTWSASDTHLSLAPRPRLPVSRSLLNLFVDFVLHPDRWPGREIPIQFEGADAVVVNGARWERVQP